MIHCKKTLQLLCTLLLLGIALPGLAEIKVTVDSNTISLQESLNLTIQSTEGDPSDIDVSPIELFFEIAQRSSSTNVSITNGSYNKIKRLQLLLLPKKLGQVTIPSFELAGERSQPIQVTITQAAAGQQNKAANDFARVELSVSDNDKSIRVQQQLIVTMRLYYQGDRFVDGRIGDIAPLNSILEKIEEKTYQDNINGIAWQVLERRYALYPQKSGQLNIPAVRFDGSMRDNRQRSFFRQGRPYKAHSNTVQIEVLAPAYTDKPWLPADNLTITSRLDQQQVRVGEPATRTIELKARGQVGEQLPEIPLVNVAGGQIYQDTSEINSKINSHGIDGIRTETIVIIPGKIGEIRLPEQQISWWDNRTQSRRELTIPSHSLTVLPAVLSSSETNKPIAATEKPIASNSAFVGQVKLNWLYIMLVALLVISLIANGFLWYRKPVQATSKTTRPVPNEQQAFTRLQKGVASVSKDEWQQLVNQWLKQIGEKHCVSTRQLMSLLRKNTHQDERQELDSFRQALDGWLYQQSDKPDMQIFLKLCQRLRQDHGYPKNYSIPGLNLEVS